jgi:hypothetical protein
MAHGTVVSCACCSVKTPRTPVLVKCKGQCGQYLHIKCAGLMDDEGVIREDFVAKKWTCEKCVSSNPEENNGEGMESTVNAKLEEMRKRMEKVEHAVSTLSQERQSASRGNVQTAPKVDKNQSKVTKKTWSSAASSSQQQIPEEVTLEQSDNTAGVEYGWQKVMSRKKKRDEHDIFVQAAEAEGGEEAEEGDLRSSVKATLGDVARAHVRDIRRVKMGVVIHCNNEEGKNAVADKLKVASEKISLRQSADRSQPRARLAVHGAYLEDFPNKEDLKADENKAFLLEEVKANNLNEKSVSVVAVLKTQPWGRRQRLDEMVKIIILADMEVKDHLLQHGLLIGVKKCNVTASDGPVTCFNCRGFGHTQYTCLNKRVCIRCAGSHLAADCNVEEEEIKCVNCCNFNKEHQETIDENHQANSPDCEIYKRVKSVWRGKNVQK